MKKVFLIIFFGLTMITCFSQKYTGFYNDKYVTLSYDKEISKYKLKVFPFGKQYLKEFYYFDRLLDKYSNLTDTTLNNSALFLTEDGKKSIAILYFDEFIRLKSKFLIGRFDFLESTQTKMFLFISSDIINQKIK